MAGTSEEFAKYHKVLDQTIAAVEKMRDRAIEERDACCKEAMGEADAVASNMLFDDRDAFTAGAAHFGEAWSALQHARAVLGSISSQTRSGGK